METTRGKILNCEELVSLTSLRIINMTGKSRFEIESAIIENYKKIVNLLHEIPEGKKIEKEGILVYNNSDLCYVSLALEYGSIKVCKSGEICLDTPGNTYNSEEAMNNLLNYTAASLVGLRTNILLEELQNAITEVRENCSDRFEDLFKNTGKTLNEVVSTLKKEGYSKDDVVKTVFVVLGNTKWEEERVEE